MHQHPNPVEESEEMIEHPSDPELLPNNDARSSKSGLTPLGAVSWALIEHELPDGTPWTVRAQATVVLRLLADSGYRIVADDALAKAWEQGFATGSSRAMRMMSDEPSLSVSAPNPYAAEERP